MRTKRLIAVFFLVLQSIFGTVVPKLQCYSNFSLNNAPLHQQHQHNENETDHHQYFFHVGVFHFFGHVWGDFLLKVAESSNQVIFNIHLKEVKQVINGKTFNYLKSTKSFFDEINHNNFKCIKLKSSFFYFLEHKKTLLINLPLRAPPIILIFLT